MKKCISFLLLFSFVCITKAVSLEEQPSLYSQSTQEYLLNSKEVRNDFHDIYDTIYFDITRCDTNHLDSSLSRICMCLIEDKDLQQRDLKEINCELANLKSLLKNKKQNILIKNFYTNEECTLSELIQNKLVPLQEKVNYFLSSD